MPPASILILAGFPQLGAGRRIIAWAELPGLVVELALVEGTGRRLVDGMRIFTSLGGQRYFAWRAATSSSLAWLKAAPVAKYYCAKTPPPRQTQPKTTDVFIELPSAVRHRGLFMTAAANQEAAAWSNISKLLSRPQYGLGGYEFVVSGSLEAQMRMICIMAALFAAIALPAKAGIAVQAWGGVNGDGVDLFTLTNAKGMEARITNYGAIITAIRVPGGTAAKPMSYRALASLQTIPARATAAAMAQSSAASPTASRTTATASRCRLSRLARRLYSQARQQQAV